MNDRARNWANTIYSSDGRPIPMAFLCDECLSAAAVYGCVEVPGLWLRCTACHLKFLGVTPCLPNV